MQARTFRAACVLMCLALALPALAQYGFPIKGTFSGDWWLKKGAENHVILQFDYDGAKDLVSGVMNPGPDAVPLQKLTVTPPAGGVAEAQNGWPVHFEADGKDKAGKVTHYVVDGKLENIGAFNKHLSGTWTAGAQKGQFKMTMQ